VVTDQDLIRRAEIGRVLTDYCRGVDRRDWDLVASCFHPDAVDSHGVVEGPVSELIEWTRRKHERVTQSLHRLTNVSVLDESTDRAVTESYCDVHQTIPRDGKEPAHLSLGCRYLDVFARRDGKWRIARREVRYEWAYHVPVRRDVLAQDESMPRSARDRQDPSYLLLEGR
jgi:ketosteroid isomerase-like protein